MSTLKPYLDTTKTIREFAEDLKRMVEAKDYGPFYVVVMVEDGTQVRFQISSLETMSSPVSDKYKTIKVGE